MIANLFRFGWPRRILLHVHGWLPTERMNDWLLDFLYPDDLGVRIEPQVPAPTGDHRNG